MMIDKSLSFKEIQAYQDDRISMMQNWVQEFGNVFTLRMAIFNLMIVNEPALVRELLVKKVTQIHRDPFTSKVFKRFLGEGVLAAEGKMWQRKRRLVRPAFHARRIQDYTAVMTQYTQEMVNGWQAGHQLAIDKELTQLTLRIIAKTIYNVDVAEQAEEIGRNMAIAAKIAEGQLGQPLIPPKWVPTPNNRKQNRAIQNVHALLLEIINQRKASGEDAGDLLSMLIQARDEDGSALSDEELLDECMTLFFAGHETTAALLTWTWYLLSKNPEVKQKLQSEIDTALNGKPIAFEDMEKLPFTEWVIKEGLRLYPPAWSLARVALEDMTLGGRAVPKNTVIFASPFLMHRSAEHFPDPERFWPERWADDQPQPDRFAYFPFGAGPRVCLGNMFAMLEAKVILATIVQNFDLDLLSEKIELDLQVTLRPKDSLMMQVLSRE
ncbi:MAG: cytochrome P450 [Chloroflexota bacterium]